MRRHSVKDKGSSHPVTAYSAEMVCVRRAHFSTLTLDQALVKRGPWRQTLMYDWFAKLHTCAQARWQPFKRLLDPRFLVEAKLTACRLVWTCLRETLLH